MQVTEGTVRAQQPAGTSVAQPSIASSKYGALLAQQPSAATATMPTRPSPLSSASTPAVQSQLITCRMPIHMIKSFARHFPQLSASQPRLPIKVQRELDGGLMPGVYDAQLAWIYICCKGYTGSVDLRGLEPGFRDGVVGKWITDWRLSCQDDGVVTMVVSSIPPQVNKIRQATGSAHRRAVVAAHHATARDTGCVGSSAVGSTDHHGRDDGRGARHVDGSSLTVMGAGSKTTVRGNISGTQQVAAVGAAPTPGRHTEIANVATITGEQDPAPLAQDQSDGAAGECQFQQVAAARQVGQPQVQSPAALASTTAAGGGSHEVSS